MKGICTPNKIEFERLYNAAFTKQDSGEKQQDELDVEEAAQDDDLMFEGINGLSKNARRVYDLANFYGGVVFIKKGMKVRDENAKTKQQKSLTTHMRVRRIEGCNIKWKTNHYYFFYFW